jgi:peptide-methionine (S)-S-oxide reductase
MSRRFLGFAGLVLVFVVSSAIVRAQEDAKANRDSTASKSGGLPELSSSPSDSDTKTVEKAAPAKSKTSAPKAKSRKSAARSSSNSSADSGSSAKKYELATFGGGCFWHVEADFERLNGVLSAVSGYAGGTVRNPNYELVHEGITGHAEVVMVKYDPEIITYEDLLKEFFLKIHDPTQLNRQGPDVGTQYRSIILFHNEAQKKAALAFYDKLVEAGTFRAPIVTRLEPLRAFYRAEDEHQDYYGGKPRASSRRKAASSSKAKKTQAKVTKSLKSKPADDGKPLEPEGANRTDAPTEKGAESKP